MKRSSARPLHRRRWVTVCTVCGERLPVSKRGRLSARRYVGHILKHHTAKVKE